MQNDRVITAHNSIATAWTIQQETLADQISKPKVMKWEEEGYILTVIQRTNCPSQKKNIIFSLFSPVCWCYAHFNPLPITQWLTLTTHQIRAVSSKHSAVRNVTYRLCRRSAEIFSPWSQFRLNAQNGLWFHCLSEALYLGAVVRAQIDAFCPLNGEFLPSREDRSWL